MTAGPREVVALASVGIAEPPADGTEIRIGDETWTVQYVPTLSVLGMTGHHDLRGRPLRRILLRAWNERVFLHEVLHVLLDQRVKAHRSGEDDWESYDRIFPSPTEAIVQSVEDALWDMGWRWAEVPS